MLFLTLVGTDREITAAIKIFAVRAASNFLPSELVRGAMKGTNAIRAHVMYFYLPRLYYPRLYIKLSTCLQKYVCFAITINTRRYVEGDNEQECYAIAGGRNVARAQTAATLHRVRLFLINK